MELFILVLLAALGGYLMARWDTSRKTVESSSAQVKKGAQAATRSSGRWFDRTFRRGKQADAFRLWAAGNPSLSEALREWLAGLSKQEGQAFVSTLSGYMDGLGYVLNDLLEGKLESQPEVKRVWIETIEAYAGEYRKSKGDQAAGGQVAAAEPVADEVASEPNA